MAGKWPQHKKKFTVEQSLVLNVNRLSHDGVLIPGSSGKLTFGKWYDSSRVSYPFHLSSDNSSPSISIRYTLFHENDESTEKKIECIILLESSTPNYGGVRWWMQCPICNKRVVKLYLPPKLEHDYFACRDCHDLTYQTTRRKEPKTMVGKRLKEMVKYLIDNY